MLTVPRRSISWTWAPRRPSGNARPTRNDEELPITQLDVAAAELDRETSAQDKEEVVRVVMLVPDELAMDPHHHELVVVEIPDDPGTERFVEQCDLLGQVDLLIQLVKLLSVSRMVSGP